ncbi:MAG TPA: ABC transporter permease [Pyrinomonadaceae bacterium]|nr:ABC transporter permease [Pyrinomonadaceae bacterium]
MTTSSAGIQSSLQHRIVVDAERKASNSGLAELWRYRELLYFLTWRDVKLRYKQTILGVTWAIIQPLLAMLLFTLIFARLAQIPSDNVPYPLFAYAGLLPWTFFANSITGSANSLVGSAGLVTKVYFPRLIIPAAPVMAGLVDLAIAFVLVIPLLAYYRITITWQLLLLPVFLAWATLLAFGVGTLMATLNVRYRDIRYALPFLVQLWLFASPVIYPLSIVPAKWKWVSMLNPMTGVIEGVRSALFGHPFDWPALAVSFAVSLLVTALSVFYFRRAEDNFADVI